MTQKPNKRNDEDVIGKKGEEINPQTATPDEREEGNREEADSKRTDFAQNQ